MGEGRSTPVAGQVGGLRWWERSRLPGPTVLGVRVLVYVRRTSAPASA